MKVRFMPSGTIAEVEYGTTIMNALRMADIRIDAPCGGNGTCKKCKVKLMSIEGENTVLACQTEITGDVTVDISRKDEGHRILMGGISRDVTPAPAVRAVTVKNTRSPDHSRPPLKLGQAPGLRGQAAR